MNDPSPAKEQATSCVRPRGALVVLEGGDRCGKTTQAKLLTDAIPNSISLKFPDRTSLTGIAINKYLTSAETVLDDETVHLLFAANRREHEHRMRDMLMNGKTLVVDRYAFSGVAYSAAKGLDSQWCMSPDVGLPQPDLVIYLDLPAHAAAARGGYGIERYETQPMQDRVRTLFTDQLKDDKYWKIVNADQPVDQLHSYLLNLVHDYAIKPAAAGTPIRDLWVGQVPRLECPPIETLIQRAQRP